MNIVKPFNGITYNNKIIDDFSKVLTPPYDIIDPHMQEKLYNIHPYNFIRIDFGKKFKEDSEDNNVYTRAKEYFENWLKNNILVKDEIPTFYFLIQEFTIKKAYQSEHFKRIGFFGIYKLSDYSTNTIMPHEKTQTAPKEDRYLLTKTCMAYFSGVFSIYEDYDFFIEKIFDEHTKNKKPEFTFFDYDNVKNSLFKINNPDITSKISEFMKDKPLYIADGHHRYETALRISKELKHLNCEATDYTIMYFTNMCSKSLKILPTHRVLHNIKINYEDLERYLENFFDSKEISYHNIDKAIEELEKMKNHHSFIIVLKDKILHITLKNINMIKHLFPQNLPSILLHLDVNILYYVILKGFFNISEMDLALQKNISYEKDYKNLIEKVKSGQATAGFILNSPDVNDLKNVSLLGETMPQKSTYFYPKIPSGAVIYSFDGKNF